MNDAGIALQQYRDLVVRYHTTLDLMSDRGVADLDRFIAEGQRFAALVERLAGPTATVVDVGSGAGLPGIVIAACLPGSLVHLVERRRRRVAFLELAAAALGLANARVFGEDVRTMTGVTADVVTAQAVTGLAELAGLASSVMTDATWLLTRRGEGWRADAEGITAGAEVVEEPLEHRGSLVALKLLGGAACRSSA